MIESIHLKNFKSYKEATLTFAPLTLMIGANASGKSNALEAVRLLSLLAKGKRLKDIQSEDIGNNSSPIRGIAEGLFIYPGMITMPGDSFSIGCKIDEPNINGWNSLTIDIAIPHQYLVINDESVVSHLDERPLYEVDKEDKHHIFKDTVSVKYNSFKNSQDTSSITCSNQIAIFYQLETPGSFEKDDKKSQELIPAVSKAFRENLRSISFLDPHPSLMRSYSHVSNYEMMEDANNLSSVLNRIWEENTPIGDKTPKTILLDFVRSLPEQDITDIKFIKPITGDVAIRLVENFGNTSHTTDAPWLSDGTLRVLAVAGQLLTAPEESLVIIEEIDNGIHPSRAKSLIKNIHEIAKLRKLRVLLTSHNPALVDALPDECVGDVLCCYRDPGDGSSRIIRLRDFDRYPELIARDTLGQLMTKGILERYLKDKSSPEDRKQAAQEWLTSLKDKRKTQ